jgi:hypothetical protein
MFYKKTHAPFSNNERRRRRKMKKITLSLSLILIFTMTAYAGCIIKQECPAYTNLDTLMAIYRVWNISGTSPQTQKMVKEALDKGILIVVPANTPIERVDKINDDLSRVTIKGTQVFIMNGSMVCD